MTITKHRVMLEKCYKRIKVMDQITLFETHKQNHIDKRIKIEKNIEFCKNSIDKIKRQQSRGGENALQLDELLNDMIEALCYGEDLCNKSQKILDNADARILFLRTRLSTDLKF
jgi:ribosome assembly protein YihI (activator of Der GTPase)